LYVSILIGNGDGTFKIAENYLAGSEPISVTAGDFNGDGPLDLAVANYFSDDVSILVGNGDASFQAAVNYLADFRPVSVTTGDFNGDGPLDLAVANSGTNNVVSVLVCLQKVLDKSGIKIREGFRFQIPFSGRLSNL
jgi:hypothetical protein